MFRKLKTTRLQIVLSLIMVLTISIWANLSGSSTANEVSIVTPFYTNSETAMMSVTDLEEPAQIRTRGQGKLIAFKTIEVFTVNNHLTLVLRFKSQLAWLDILDISPTTSDEWSTQVFQIATFGDQPQPSDLAGISGSLSLVDGLDRHFVLYLKWLPPYYQR